MRESNSLVLTGNSGQTMSSLDLRDVINKARESYGESKVENSHLLKRIEDELDGELGGTKTFRPAQGGTPMAYYDLTIDQCMLIGMRESKAVRRTVLGVLNKTKEPSVPKTYAEALIEAGRLAQINEQQAEQLAIAAPKADFVDHYVTADTGSKGFRQVAKLLCANEVTLRKFLTDEKIMYRLGGEWMPYQNHIDAGRFEVKTGVAGEHAFNQAKFTAKGVNWIAGLWGQHVLKNK